MNEKNRHDRACQAENDLNCVGRDTQPCIITAEDSVPCSLDDDSILPGDPFFTLTIPGHVVDQGQLPMKDVQIEAGLDLPPATRA